MRIGLSLSLALIAIAIGCSDEQKSSQRDTPTETTAPGLTPEILTANGFQKNASGLYTCSTITMKDLCKLLLCTPNDFGLVPNQNPEFRTEQYTFLGDNIACAITIEKGALPDSSRWTGSENVQVDYVNLHYNAVPIVLPIQTRPEADGTLPP